MVRSGQQRLELSCYTKDQALIRAERKAAEEAIRAGPRPVGGEVTGGDAAVEGAGAEAGAFGSLGQGLELSAIGGLWHGCSFPSP